MLNYNRFFVVLLLFCCYHLTTSNNDPICDKPAGSCMCYFELEESLLATERNLIQLSTTFFPLESNQPEFVTVTYTFVNSSITQFWFWSIQTSHFLHPFEVFQFMSLFFSKPEPYYTGELTIQLNAECSKLSPTDENLHILTQRLKYYAERRSPILRDSYSAKAYSEESLTNLLNNNHGRTTNIIICTAVFVVILSLAVISMVLGCFFCTESHSSSIWAEKVKNHYTAVFALTSLSFIANMYVICLAGSAVGYWAKQGKTELRKLFHEYDEKRNLGPLVFSLLVDIMCLIVWFIIIIGAACKFTKSCERVCTCCRHVCEHTDGSNCVHAVCRCANCAPDCLKENCKCNRCDQCKLFYDGVVIISCSVLCPIFCVIAHSPYIAIAYLNDGSHASSIFIYYSIVGYSLFALLYIFYHWFKNVTDPMRKLGFNLDQFSQRFWIIVLLVVVSFVFLGLVVVITCYFVFIPINKSISDAPNRVLSIYQTGGFVLGSVILYEVLSHFHKKRKENGIAEYVKKIQADVNKILNVSTQQQPATNSEGPGSTTTLEQNPQPQQAVAPTSNFRRTNSEEKSQQSATATTLKPRSNTSTSGNKAQPASTSCCFRRTNST